MINKSSKLSVSFKETNPYLKCKGNYTPAKVSVKNARMTDDDGNSIEEWKLLSPLQTNTEPEFTHATRTLNLGYAFLENALNLDKNGKSQRPMKPRNNDSYEKWNRYNNWNRLSDDDKVRFHLMEIAKDQGLKLVSFEIM